MSSNSLTTLSYTTRRELIERAAPLYREASLAQKGLLLDRMVAMTGYARKYAIHLLNHAPPGKRTIHRRRQPALWLSSAARPLARLEGCQVHLRQTLDPVFTHSCGGIGTAWISPAERGEQAPPACHEHHHR